MGLHDFTLFDVIERNAKLFPDRPAFLFDGQRVTHAQYLARVERLAAGLAGVGVGLGDRIAVVSHNNLEFADLYGAAARIGAILVPVNWRQSADEIAYIISDSEPKVLIADTPHQDILRTGQQTLPSIRCYGIGGHGKPFLPFEELLSANVPSGWPDVPSDAGFVMLHTAAVAGRPRGALLSHAGLIASHVQFLRYWALTPQDVNLGVLPLFHLAGAALMLATQQAGGMTTIIAKFEAERVLRQIAEEKVTLMGEFPPILSTLLDQAKDTQSLSSLRIVTGLEAPDTIARFEQQCPDARFWSVFGQSETSGFVTMAPFREKPGSAGRPTFLCKVAVVDDLDRELPPGQTGEIVVRGPSVFKGYWKCEADNAFTFRNGWHHTGDNGAFDEQGYLWYKGRSPAKDLIKPGGENVYPAEVEGAIAAHPAIAEVAVIGVPDAQWGEAIKAVCACKAGQSVTAREIIDFVGERIARYKRPKHVAFVAALPKTAAGSVDRAKVKEEHGAG